MPAIWVTVGPMHNATFFVPLIFAVERDYITLRNGRNSRGQINVVGDENGLTGR